MSSETVSTMLFIFAAVMGAITPLAIFWTNRENRKLNDQIRALRAEVQLLEKMIINLTKQNGEY